MQVQINVTSVTANKKNWEFKISLLLIAILGNTIVSFKLINYNNKNILCN